MYLDHWSLEFPPFEPVPDSRFLFATAAHEQALAAISYAACDGGEPVLITGAPGCGKTLLLRALRRQLPQAQYHVAFVPEVACSQIGLARRIAYHLAHTVAPNVETALDMILAQARESGKKGETIVLMLDDWPAEPARYTLEELRWLLNIDIENCRLVVLLTGESYRPNHQWPPWLTQRLSTTAELGPLTAAQVPAYLAHRLHVAAAAGAESRQHEQTFMPEAAGEIAAWSGCVPRLINRAAHLALHVAYLDLAPQVTAEAVRRAVARLAPVSEPRPGPRAATPELVELAGAAT